MSRHLGCALLIGLLACDGAMKAPAPGWQNSFVKTPVAMVPSHVAIHRLTNDEYTNTAQDLLFTSARPGDGFPQSSIGQSGFRNDSTELAVSPDWVARAYASADALATALIASKGVAGGAYERLATCPSGTSGGACANTLLTSLASRAYRRPVDATELAQLMAAFTAQASFDAGMHDALVAMLLSPKFLFVWSANPGGTSMAALDDYALASRLSYFLWQTMPDEVLFQAAARGELSTSEGLDAQVQRMLADPRAMRLAQTLAREWAGLANLESSSITGLEDALRMAMVQETDLFISDLIQNDRSLLNLVSSNYSFVNKPLADLYGLGFPGDDPAAFTRVSLGESKRTGVVTQASVLTVTAGAADFTHPVRRGFWVAQRVMCASPPPPPMDVPPLEQDPTSAVSIRDRLNEHVASPACSGCHVVMDAVGLGLENYDPIGRWRDTYPGQSAAIDASGVLPGNAEFVGPAEMFEELASQTSVRSCLVKQMISLALTRASAGPADHALAKMIADEQLTEAGTFSGMISQIVQSPQFRQQLGEAP